MSNADFTIWSAGDQTPVLSLTNAADMLAATRMLVERETNPEQTYNAPILVLLGYGYEFAFKSWILHLGNKPDRTHNLVDLWAICQADLCTVAEKSISVWNDRKLNELGDFGEALQDNGLDYGQIETDFDYHLTPLSGWTSGKYPARYPKPGRITHNPFNPAFLLSCGEHMCAYIKGEIASNIEKHGSQIRPTP